MVAREKRVAVNALHLPLRLARLVRHFAIGAAAGLGALAAVTGAAVAPAPRQAAHLIVVNDDGFSGFFRGEYRTADDLRRRVRDFSDTPVAVLEWGITSGSRVNFPARSVELVGTGVTEFPRRGDRLVTETLHRLAREGTDTLQVVAAACRDAGIACYASVRMNGDYNTT